LERGEKIVTGTKSGGYKMGSSWPVRKYYSVLHLGEREELYLGDILEDVKGKRTGLVTFCVETAFFNGLLKERYKGG
jgi:hypothetical protein